MRIYTRRGDGGTTDLRGGGRVPKDSPVIELTGTVDEAQAALGLARAECTPGGELDAALTGIERDLWILMAEVATAPDRRAELEPGRTAVTPEMVAALEEQIDAVVATIEVSREFAVPGGSRCSAALDLARAVVRRAERLAVSGVALGERSQVGPYLNRLSDLCWALARATEHERVLAIEVPGGPAARPRAVGRKRGER